ncbi:glycerate kinase [Nocardioides sp. CFH 31398]|uniref:glycerate kinase family protein n=1 Tax=Nocardioides sp. CFH 31398 TaxID=2919579 RepID=UPI001F0639FF|nr:glycerate kinase [Nocardioides sp. CFH 31398]MCH1866013.1 glycerate kinase [Nocardioides sp. CFH 31398]
MRLRVLIAPSGFKESLSAEEVADCVASGVRRAVPDALILKTPVPDGGEGFARTLVNAVGGTLHDVTVTGPVGEPVDSYFGLLEPTPGDDGQVPPPTAVLEMAAAAGLRHVPRDQRDLLGTTTYGVGELITAALDAGARRILLGCGDSGTNDGGAGMAQALGARLLDADGTELGRGGGELSRLASVDLSGLDPRLTATEIEVACNWDNVLTGPRGVARVFGPQKGADEETVRALEDALDTYADVLDRDTGHDVRSSPGSGASGGLGAGAQALLGATLHPRFDVITRYLDFDALLGRVDLVITAEGAIDRQSARGKVPAEVARHAGERDIPIIALTGTVGEGVQAALDAGLDAFASILTRPQTLEQALREVRDSLTTSAEQTMRLLLVGRRLAWQQAEARSV